VEYAILDLSPNGNMDTTALRSLQELVDDYIGRGVQLCLCNPGTDVMEVLVSSGFADKVGYDNIFVSEHQAVSVCLERLGDQKLKEIVDSPTPLDNSFDNSPSGEEEP